MTAMDSRRVKLMHLLGTAIWKVEQVAKAEKCMYLKDDANALNTMKHLRDYRTLCMAMMTMDPLTYNVSNELRGEIKGLYDLGVMCLTVEIEGCDVRDEEYANIVDVAASLGMSQGNIGVERQVIVVLPFSSN